MAKLNEAYVLGLLADLEASVPTLEKRFGQARKRARAVDAELANLLRRLDASTAALKEAQSQTGRSSVEINERNLRIAALHQEIATIRKKSEEIKLEMDRVGPGAIFRKLRRERAKLSVQIEDREVEITDLRDDVEGERDQLKKAETTLVAERDRSRAVTQELDKLQAQLPSPFLYTELFESVAARAHCRLYLDHDGAAWKKELREAIGWSVELHEALRAGKYRLDRNSDLVGGRAMATAEALYGAVGLGDKDLALVLFSLAADPGLFFHQIFNIFRVWCLGLYLTGRRTDLKELLRIHQYAPGLRGGYVRAFSGLLAKDPKRLTSGIKEITKHEWEGWQDPARVRGAGVVSLGAVALSQLAGDVGVAVAHPGPTVPRELWDAASTRSTAPRVNKAPRLT